MSEKIAWKKLSEDEQRKNNDLWGETSNLKDPIISRPYNVLMPICFGYPLFVRIFLYLSLYVEVL